MGGSNEGKKRGHQACVQSLHEENLFVDAIAGIMRLSDAALSDCAAVAFDVAFHCCQANTKPVTVCAVLLQ